MGRVKKGSDRVAAVAALNEPLRRKLYDYVVSENGGVTRDDAVEATAVARSVAAFHLDKLVDAGLLRAEFRRPPGRGGPGAGRPAKYYLRAVDELSVTVPERRYELPARLFAEAVERAETQACPVAETLRDAAREEGRRIAADGAPSGGSRSDTLLELLAEHGYEPRLDGGTITLRNCPFHALAVEHRGLVCGMNLALLSGFAEAAGLPRSAVRLDPAPGRCCVTLRTGRAA